MDLSHALNPTPPSKSTSIAREDEGDDNPSMAFSPIRRHGLDPSERSEAEIPSLNDLARRRGIEGKQHDIMSWMSLTEGAQLTDDGVQRPDDIDHQWAMRAEDIPAGEPTENKRIPGQTYFHAGGHGSSPTNEDVLMAIETRVWENNPLIHSIQDSNTQPESSQAAISRFQAMCHNNDSMVSRAATWGTRRKSMTEDTPSLEETPLSGNFLKKLSLGDSGQHRAPNLLSRISSIVQNPLRKLKRQADMKGDDSDEDDVGSKKVSVKQESPESSAGVGYPYTSRPSSWGVGKSSRHPSTSTNTAPAYEKMAPSVIFAKKKELHKTDDGDESSVLKKLSSNLDIKPAMSNDPTPTLESIKKNILALSPALGGPDNPNEYLVDRLGRHIVERYNELALANARHIKDASLGLCKSRTKCAGQEQSTQGEDNPLLELSSESSSDNGDTTLDSIITKDHFPPHIPVPPASHLPAEFECPLCFTVIRIVKPSDWTKHVVEDMQPFVCTWASCSHTRGFKRKADWTRHENSNHRPNSKERIGADECLFCGESFESWKKFSVHNAKHLEEITFSNLLAAPLTYRSKSSVVALQIETPSAETPTEKPTERRNKERQIGVGAKSKHVASPNEDESMRQIKEELTFGLEKEEPVVFKLDWDLEGFISRNYEHGTKLSSVLALTGNLDTAILCSVKEYIELTWPASSSNLVDTLDNMLSNQVELSPLESSDNEIFWNDWNVIRFGPRYQEVLVLGPPRWTVDIAQQLCWLSAVCREKLIGNILFKAKIEDCGLSMIVSKKCSWASSFRIRVNMVEPSSSTKTACWNPLVGPSVIVTGFPCPPRQHDIQRGLEVSIPVMAALSRIPQAVTFRGNHIFKGRYHALVPTEVHERSIQWHFVDTYPKRLTWSALNATVPSVVSVDLESPEKTGKMRSFLGWCSQVVDHIGRSSYDFNAVKYSGASKREAGVRFDKVSIGFTQWAQFTGEFTLQQKDGYLRPNDYDDYETLLDDAKELPVILHDSNLDRAVQTDAENLILHILQHRRILGTFKGNPLSSKKDGQDTDQNSVTTREVMLLSQDVVVRQSTSITSTGHKDILFKEDVQRLFCVLEGLQGNDYASDGGSRPILEMRQPRWSKIPLDGWEYMDVVSNRRHMVPKMVQLRRSSGRWVEYAKDIQSVVLFAADMPELLSAGRSMAPDLTHKCRAFSSIPRDSSYLAVRVQTLRELFERQGSLQDQQVLTPSGYTVQHSSSSTKSNEIFQVHHCDLPASYEHAAGCDRTIVHRRVLKVVKRNTPWGSIQDGKSTPINFTGEGAVIIGEWDGKHGADTGGPSLVRTRDKFRNLFGAKD